MTNSDNGVDLYNEVLRGLDDLLGWHFFNIPEKHVAALKPSQMLPYVGGYHVFNDPDELFRITFADNRLWIEVDGSGRRSELLAESDMDFFVPESGFVLNFHASGGDDRSEAILRMDNGQKLDVYQVVTDC